LKQVIINLVTNACEAINTGDVITINIRSSKNHRVCIQNKCIRYWMENPKVSKYDLNKQCAVLAAEFPFANNLNSMARQAAAERAWAAISRFYDNCKKKISGLKGFPSFQKDNRSVEYKTTGWKLAFDRKSITITDKIGIGLLKLKGTRDLNFYQPDQIKRVRLVKRADGYYVQFCISVDREEVISPTKSTIGLDMGLNHFYTDSNGEQVENPRFYRKAEKSMKQSQRLVSRKAKGSSNRRKARVRLSRIHLKISRQRKDHAINILNTGLGTVGHTGTSALAEFSRTGSPSMTDTQADVDNAQGDSSSTVTGANL
jgi:putative transposase